MDFIKCFACEFESISKVLLRRHTIDHFDNLIECNSCSFKTNKKWVLIHHMKKHCRKIILFECSECGFESISCTKLKMHACKKCFKKNRKYRCFICNYLLNLKFDLRQHLKSYHKYKVKIYKCRSQTYDKNLSKLNVKGLNLKEEFVRSLKKCPLCTFETNQKLVLKSHILEHLNKKFKCSLCNYVTYSAHEIDCHVQEHELTNIESDGSSCVQKFPGKVLKCFKCNFETTSDVDLKEHYRVIHFICKLKRLNEYNLEGNNNKENKSGKSTENRGFKSNVNELQSEIVKCCKCAFTTKDHNTLKLHKRKHYKTQYFKCPECDIETSRRFFNKHLRTHSIKTHKCFFCSYSANNMSRLKRHVLAIHTSSDLLRCPECNFETTDRKKFKDHDLTHMKQISRCPICYRVFKTMYFKSHLMTHSDVRLFQCPICSYKAKFKRHLKTHTDIMHSYLKWFQCMHCKYQTLDKVDLKNHTFLNHVPIKCPHCDHEIYGKRRLNSHLLTHTNIKIKEDPVSKIFYCSLCEYSTSKIIKLEYHILTHTKKKYNCSHCNYVTTHRGHFTMHLKSHNPTKLLKCPTCNYESTQAGHMNRHLKTHSDLRPVCCPKCSFRTRTKEYLKRHLETHNPKELKCSQCNYCTNRQSLLRNHMKHHKVS